VEIISEAEFAALAMRTPAPAMEEPSAPPPPAPEEAAPEAPAPDTPPPQIAESAAPEAETPEAAPEVTIPEPSPEAEVEWTVHMPARGTLYALVSGRPDESGARVGRLRAGSLEFETRSGRVFERYDSSPGSHGGDDGRLILTTILVNDAYDLELEEATMAEVSQ